MPFGDWEYLIPLASDVLSELSVVVEVVDPEELLPRFWVIQYKTRIAPRYEIIVPIRRTPAFPPDIRDPFIDTLHRPWLPVDDGFETIRGKPGSDLYHRSLAPPKSFEPGRPVPQ